MTQMTEVSSVSCNALTLGEKNAMWALCDLYFDLGSPSEVEIWFQKVKGVFKENLERTIEGLEEDIEELEEQIRSLCDD